jgi:replication factor A3
MEKTSNPRVTCPYLDSYVGQSVMVIGKVMQLRGETAIIDADGNITAHLNRVCVFRQLMGESTRGPYHD